MITNNLSRTDLPFLPCPVRYEALAQPQLQLLLEQLLFHL